jgi:gas vesicle protein
MADRDGNSILWFLAGLGVGAVVGVLYAPRSGSETRRVILDKAEEGREYMRDRAQDARSQASEWVDRGREILNQQREQFKSAYDAGRQAYRETTTKPEGEPAKNV